MPFTFGLITPTSINDPNMFLDIEGSETSSGDGRAGETMSFNSTSDVKVSVADNFVDDGGSNLTEAVTIGGTTYPAGSLVEADYEVIFVDQASGLYYRVTYIAIDQDYVGATISRGWDATTGQYVDKYPVGTTLTAIDGDTLDGTPNINDFATDSNYAGPGGVYGNDAILTADNGTIICFARGAMIATGSGETAIEELAIGDTVATADGGSATIRWIGRSVLDASALACAGHLRPIRIRAGALGPGAPSRDLVVSPQHRVLVRSKIALRMFGVEEVLTPAKSLLRLDGVEIAEDVAEVEYWHFLCDRHEIVFANGAATESLLAGHQALRSVSAEERAEILTLFPEFAAETAVQPAPARPLAARRRGERLAARHAKNRVALQTAAAAV